MPSLISLSMTVYNREKYLSIALDSILAQTYPHWKLTIWDDGSSDSSPDIAIAYARTDPRIHFIAAPHTGRQYALRAAIEASRQKSSYLAWIDDDDILAPEALSATITILDSQPSIGMVYTDYWIMSEIGQALDLGTRCKIPYSKERLLIDFMTFNFRLMRWEVYDLVGGIDLDFPQAQDYDICLKISEVTDIYHLQQPLYYYRQHQSSISHSQKSAQTERSATSVRNALIRRGLSNTCELNVSEKGRFLLKRINDATLSN
jgi:glycosyltransferase involved in cell wall biosynthesis